MKKKQEITKIDQEFEYLLLDKQEVKELLENRPKETISFMDVFNSKINKELENA